MTLRTDLEASLELETLRAEVKRLREALTDLVDWLSDNRRQINPEFSMDEFLADARNALSAKT